MGLKLSELPANKEVFIDANIFLYSAFKHPVFGNKCKNFLIGVEKGEIKGYTSDFVLNEIFHKLIIAEVVKKFGIAAKQVVRFVKKKPAADTRESPVREMVKELKEFGVDVYGYDLLLSREEIKDFGINALDDFNVKVDCVIITVTHDEFINPFLKRKRFRKEQLFSKRTFPFLAQVLSLERKCWRRSKKKRVLL